MFLSARRLRSLIKGITERAKTKASAVYPGNVLRGSFADEAATGRAKRTIYRFTLMKRLFIDNHRNRFTKITYRVDEPFLFKCVSENKLSFKEGF